MSDAAARYGVEVELKKVGDGWDDLSAGVGKFTGMLDAAAGKLGNLTKYAVVGLGAGAFAAATYGVSKLNAEAEGAAISIGTIFSVNGLAANVPAGITMAQDTIAKMRVDAQKLPGEFKDLQQIFTMGAIPMFQAGAGVDQARHLSAQVMAAASVLQVPMDVAAREFGMLLAGRAGAHNQLGVKLGFSGDKAKELNAADGAKRIKMVEAEATKFSGAIDIFSHSYEGLSSTLVDNIKNFGRLSSMPLFESVKDTMNDINVWWGKNQESIDRFAGHLGIGIKDAFEWGKNEIIEWYPIVENFVEVAWHRMEAFWDDVKPSVMAFGQAFKEALSDPNGTIDKLKTVLELYAAIKVGGALIGAGGALNSMASGAGGIMNGLGLLGGGGAAAGAAGAAGPTMITGGALAGLDVGAAGVGAAFLAAVAAWGVAIYEGIELHKEIQSEEMANKNAIAEAKGREVEALIKHGYGEDMISEKLKEVAEAYSGHIDAMGNVTRIGDETQWALNDVATAAVLAANGLDALSGSYAAEGDRRMKAAGDEAADNLLAGATQAAKMWLEGVKSTDPNKKKAPAMKGGHGGTNIQKVEIVVTSNSSPSRIARVVEARLANLSRNRRSSQFVPNYSSRDEGR